MNMEHTVAVALIVLGVVGCVSMLAYRLAMQCVDLRAVPVRLAGRATWWSQRVWSLSQASALLLAVGVIGFVTT